MPELSPQFWLNWWVQLAVALCTLLAVLVALFGQGFRVKFFPPRLSLTVADPDGEKTKVRITWTENNISKERLEDARYYRLSVSNARRWSPANQVRAVLIRVKEPAADGQFAASWVGCISSIWNIWMTFATPSLSSFFGRWKRLPSLWVRPRSPASMPAGLTTLLLCRHSSTPIAGPG